MTLEDIRTLCLSLPAVTEDIKWGHDLCFSVGAKMFCVCGVEPPHGASFKVTEEEFEEMAARNGFIPAPYMARNKWVQAQELDALSHSEWAYYLRQSYELVKAKLPAKVRKEIDATQ